MTHFTFFISMSEIRFSFLITYFALYKDINRCHTDQVLFYINLNQIASTYKFEKIYQQMFHLLLIFFFNQKKITFLLYLRNTKYPFLLLLHLSQGKDVSVWMIAKSDMTLLQKGNVKKLIYHFDSQSLWNKAFKKRERNLFYVRIQHKVAKWDKKENILLNWNYSHHDTLI